MVIDYTKVWNGFQFRSPTYLDGHFEPYKFDLVKWEECELPGIIDLYTGKPMNSKYCYSIASLTWDKEECTFDFQSVGLRYLENRIDGLEKFILDFCDMMRDELDKED